MCSDLDGMVKTAWMYKNKDKKKGEEATGIVAPCACVCLLHWNSSIGRKKMHENEGLMWIWCGNHLEGTEALMWAEKALGGKKTFKKMNVWRCITYVWYLFVLLIWILQCFLKQPNNLLRCLSARSQMRTVRHNHTFVLETPGGSSFTQAFDPRKRLFWGDGSHPEGPSHTQPLPLEGATCDSSWSRPFPSSGRFMLTFNSGHRLT